MNVLKFICRTCKKEKFACEFSYSRTSKNGFKIDCRSCLNEKKYEYNNKRKGLFTEPVSWGNLFFGKSPSNDL